MLDVSVLSSIFPHKRTISISVLPPHSSQSPFILYEFAAFLNEFGNNFIFNFCSIDFTFESWHQVSHNRNKQPWHQDIRSPYNNYEMRIKISAHVLSLSLSLYFLIK
uniref:Uncharacterized protein n=1 Tax=Cacopsylla melanoneura TaxID=428564 RepID=A0A8D9BKD6_9HEMI